jgi:spore germination cell wall hydrolase CwlJ-like protein
MIGLSIGGAYLAGGMARAAVVHAHMARLADVASGGFSEAALTASQGEDTGALAVARRHDPFFNIDLDARERHVAALTAQLAQKTPAANPLIVRASYGETPAAAPTLSNPPPVAMRPFALRGVLDQSRDLECLTQAVYYEARGESRGGQQAVAQVVLNRTRHPAFPSSVCGVVFQGARNGGCQFSFACDGSVGRPVERAAWRRAEAIAAKALDGFVMPDVGSATHFHVIGLSPQWRNRLTRVAQVGSHVFYRFGGRAGRASAFDDVPELSPPAPTPAPVEPAPVKTEYKPVFASLSLAPVATAVAQGVAQGAAELVAAAASIRKSPEAATAKADFKSEAKPDAVKAEAAASPLPVKVAPALAPIAKAQPAATPAAKAEDAKAPAAS